MKYLYLYPDLATKTLDLLKIDKYLKEKLPKVKVVLRKDFFLYWLGKEEKKYKLVAKKVASSRIADLNSKSGNIHPLPMEIEYERNNLLNPGKRKIGILYDGFSFQNIGREIISEKGLKLGDCQIVFTNQLLATYDENDRRYHLRTSIYGIPNLISTSGIVEAPAKPKEYYLLKNLGEMATEEWKEKNKEKFINYNDQRLTEVLKGYLMHAIFYSLTGDPFCKDKNCRLYNAHWQEELIKAQLNKKKDFCKAHQKILDYLR
ncbi:MAG TPA: hypothetical protein DHV62_01475 [Elusimicrobia bacterium]|jgi:hypothetical protein|nr:hypothetical protein [Elusimicrobiota bacterium]